MNMIVSLVTSLALTLGATAALAEDKPMPPKEGMMHERYMKTDTDSDGNISKAEWSAQGEKMFKEIDANNDGKITKDEMKAHRESKVQEWKERRDDRKERREEMKAKKDTGATPAEAH